MARKNAAQQKAASRASPRPASPRAKTAAATDGHAAEAAARRDVIATALAMSRTGLSPGRSGNVSCRWAGGMLITPSGVAYETLKPRDIVFVAADGSVETDALKPSSEWRFHLATYAARPDMGAVVHTHSLHATVLACAHMPIPAFHYVVAIAGGVDIPLVPYATFGTEELSAHVARGLAERNACLMANHGQIAVGPTLAAALELAHEVETLAEQYYKVLTLGRVHLLGTAEMADVLERFKGYGRNAAEAAAAQRSPAAADDSGTNGRGAQ